VRRRLFWPLIAVGSLCLLLGGASLAAALFSTPLPRAFADYAPQAPTDSGKLGVSEPEIHYYYTGTEAFGRPISLSWSSDKGFLIAAILFGTAGVATHGFASRVR
jgi:hypothetical protein